MSRPWRVVLPKDLISPVDEMNDHLASVSQWRTPAVHHRAKGPHLQTELRGCGVRATCARSTDPEPARGPLNRTLSAAMSVRCHQGL
jgi:hypothetical protein